MHMEVMTSSSFPLPVTIPTILLNDQALRGAREMAEDPQYSRKL